MRTTNNINASMYSQSLCIKLFFMLLVVTASTLNSCKNFLDIDPPEDSATTKQVFENDVIATSAITGIYNMMVKYGAFSGDNNSIATLSAMSSDEFKSHNVFLNGFYQNQLASNDATISSLWGNSYNYIYTANAILSGLEKENGLTSSYKKQIEGEAKFIRAFCYFYLVNLFGDVPLHLTTDYRVNGSSKKSSREQVYSQIIKDLQDCEVLLSVNYVTSERVRPNQAAAKALLARVYLYVGNWNLAEVKTTEVIENDELYSLESDLDMVFIKSSKEAIWQLMPATGTNTQEGNLLILSSTPNFVSLSEKILPFFDVADNRKTKWINEYTDASGTYYYSFKYKEKYTSTFNEYSMVIRLAELHLIRAEARANQNNPILALEDINKIRYRAGLITSLVGLDKEQCLVEIEKQRRLELFSEWGHRWLDLKRTGRASAVLSTLKGASWQNTDVLYPIPVSETNANREVIQNDGY